MITGHATLSDWLFLIAAILFIIATLGFISPQYVTRKLQGVATGLGLALFGIAFLVL